MQTCKICISNSNFSRESKKFANLWSKLKGIFRCWYSLVHGLNSNYGNRIMKNFQINYILAMKVAAYIKKNAKN